VAIDSFVNTALPASDVRSGGDRERAAPLVPWRTLPVVVRAADRSGAVVPVSAGARSDGTVSWAFAHAANVAISSIAAFYLAAHTTLGRVLRQRDHGTRHRGS
jgi:hypothetical protein